MPRGNWNVFPTRRSATIRRRTTRRSIVSPEQIAEDLAELAKVSKCIRTYSIDNGLDKVPELASKVGLKVLLGVWIGRDRAKNAHLIDIAVSLAKDHPDTVTAIIVGSEVLLRGEMIVSDLREIIRSVKPRVNVPVTYADVWEFWLRYREIGADVDFVTIHFLPYWEDVPPRAEDAAAHVDGIRKQVVAAFPGKEILIGETGWPSHGRMRDGALASRINQARFISEILDRARRDNFRVNLFEAYDEPWKRRWEGTVGGYWGLVRQGRSQAEISGRGGHQQLPVLEAADGVRAGSLYRRFRKRLVDAEAPAVAPPDWHRGRRWRYPRPPAGFCWA